MEMNSEWEPAEDELLGRLVDLEMEKEKYYSDKKKNPVHVKGLEAIEAEQEMVRRLYHG